MAGWERDPEGTTLAWLHDNVPGLQHVVDGALALLPARPMMLFALSELSERDLWAIAYVYNNLMSLYGRGAARRVRADRFVCATATALRAANAACATHTATYLREVSRGRLVAWTNSWTLVQDTGHAYVPHSAALRNVMRVFEAYVSYGKTMRLCEIIDAADGEVVIVDRMFASVAQYQRFVDSFDKALTRRQTLCARQLNCAQCCPCVATAVLSLFPADDRFCLPYNLDEDEKIVPEWFAPSQAITTRWMHFKSLETVQNGVLWFFSGVPNPLGTFFRVAASLVDASCTDVGRAVAVVQETAVRSFLAMRNSPDTARRRQMNFIRPALLIGRLFDATTDNYITDLRSAPES